MPKVNNMVSSNQTLTDEPSRMATYPNSSGEVNLVDLFRIVRRRKWIIFSSLVVSLLLGSAYVILAETVYLAKVQIIPPQKNNISDLLVEYQGVSLHYIDSYTPDTVYARYQRNLRSQGLLESFISESDSAKQSTSHRSDDSRNDDQNDATLFRNNLKIQNDAQDRAFVTVHFMHSDPEFAANWLNSFVEFVNEFTVLELVNEINVSLQDEVKRVRLLIDNALKVAEQERYDQIAALGEALRIAQALGIQEPNTLVLGPGNDNSNQAANIVRHPTYMLGSGALETEIAVLESRKSDEPFVVGLRELQGELRLLESISIDPAGLSTVQIDKAANVPRKAEHPRVILTLVLAAILGTILGTGLALIYDYIQDQGKNGQ